MGAVAIATAAELPHLDEDGPLLLGALEEHGVRGTAAVWDDPGVDWAAFDAVVIRSTWDYPPRRDAFIAWAHAVERTTPLLNPADLVAWNTDKRYLAEFAGAGIPIVPTSFLVPGDPVALPGDGEFVVKPTVSAGSKDTARYLPGEHARAREHVEVLHAAGRTAMVQPYVDAVDEHGETAMLFMGGAYSHAIRKGPILELGTGFVETLYAAEDISPRTPSDAEHALAERVLAATPGGADRLTYARVDLLPGPGGQPLLIEFEITEPSLFLAHDDAAAGRLAHAIVQRLRAG